MKKAVFLILFLLFPTLVLVEDFISRAVTFLGYGRSTCFKIIYHQISVLPDQVYAGPITRGEDPATGGVSLALSH